MTKGIKGTTKPSSLPLSLPPLWMRSEPALPELVGIDAGTFIMGDDFGPRSAQPAHDITLPAFFISRFPVTVLEYSNYLIAAKRPIPTFWPHPARWLECANLPVAGVTWRDALGYCTWLGALMQRSIRLPTEAEWEKAATWNAENGTKSLYPFGNEFDPAYTNTVESLIGELTLVDQYRLVGDSAYGVSDIFGNAAEWTLAKHMPYPYVESDGRHDLNLMGYRVARGGSFQSEGKWTTAVHRQYFSPDETRHPIGFRIVVEETV